jgi:DNA recombination protein RmuC
LAALREKTANFEEQKRLLHESREALLKEFQNAGAKVLGEAQKSFLERAGERFDHAEKANEARIKALLEPVGSKLTSYEEQVRQLEAQRVDAFGNLTGLMQAMREGQDAVRAEAARLGNSLKAAPKASGRWGELHVKNVLDKCGLAERYDYVAEQSVSSQDGRLRPDFVVDVPGNKKIIIDAKNIWKDYDRAVSSDVSSEKDKALVDHVNAIKSHIKLLSAKGYYGHIEGAADYVVLFIPGEHLLYAALEKDDGLWNFSFSHNVLLATPTNLVAICKTVATVWQQEGLTRDAQEIGRLGAGLYDSLAKTQEDIAKMGTALEAAVSRYNDFTTTYDSSVLSRARMLKDKHIAIKKRVISDDTKFVEKLPKPSSRVLGSVVPDDAE